MRNYEIVTIIHPDLDETALNAAVEKVKGWVAETGGTVEKVDLWGRRRMAYVIRKQHEGQYVLLHVALPPAAPAIMDRNLRFLEPVMRFLIKAVE
jgi:small subunit ribosomal protein S6